MVGKLSESRMKWIMGLHGNLPPCPAAVGMAFAFQQHSCRWWENCLNHGWNGLWDYTEICRHALPLLERHLPSNSIPADGGKIV